MPTLMIYRKKETLPSLQIAIGNFNQAYGPVLFPNTYVRSAYVDPSNIDELLDAVKDMEDRGVIGWGLRMDGLDSEDVKIEHGLDLGDGASANSTTQYFISCTPGRAKMGSHSVDYVGRSDANFFSATLRNGFVEASDVVPDLLADGEAYKIRWYITREYFVTSGDETAALIGVVGAPVASGSLGGLSDPANYPTDAEVDATFRSRDALTEATTRFFLDKVEIGRQILSRSGATITSSFLDLKGLDPRPEGLSYADFEIDHEDIETAGVTNTVELFPIKGIFMGAALTTLEASDLASLTVELGQSGQVDELFDGIDVGTGGSNTLGLQATAPRAAAPKLPNTALVNYAGLVTFTGGANLDTATAGKWLVRIWYAPEPEAAAVGAGVSSLVGRAVENQYQENELEPDNPEA